MPPLTDSEIEAIARRIASDLAGEKAAPAAGAAPVPRDAAGPGASRAGGGAGSAVFPTVHEAVEASRRAQPAFARLPLSVRARAIEAIRETMRREGAALAKAAHEETGLGRYEDKVVKNSLVTEKTPGLEDLAPRAVSGDHGLSLMEPAPFGVLGVITPCTNPTSTIICNSLGMLSAGNSAVFSVHPLARDCSMRTISLIDAAIVAAGGPPNVVTGIGDASVETAQALMKAPGVRLLVVTGGGEVVKAAMASGKRAICAGPGNPPVVVDESADLAKAGRDIVLGASTDNNIICTDEKEALVVAKVADELLRAMAQAGAVVIGKDRLRDLESVVFRETHGPRKPAHVRKELIGKNANVILAKMGISAPDSVRLVVADVPEDHPLLWTEQMMPVFPVCRVPNVDYAIDLAIAVEGGNRHTAVMHSKNIDALSRMARECDCSIFVKNGRSQAGLGLDGEGFCSFTIASPTGEGLTSARSFSRWRRCVLVDHFRIT